MLTSSLSGMTRHARVRSACQSTSPGSIAPTVTASWTVHAGNQPIPHG
jgi:hypothetical protein